jgi:hypothetical protein
MFVLHFEGDANAEKDFGDFWPYARTFDQLLMTPIGAFNRGELAAKAARFSQGGKRYPLFQVRRS